MTRDRVWICRDEDGTTSVITSLKQPVYVRGEWLPRVHFMEQQSVVGRTFGLKRGTKVEVTDRMLRENDMRRHA